MDVELLSKMVAELVVSHDSVSLPGLGTFVAAEMPASFSDRGFAINPPYRKLSFMLGGVDDGLLSGLYAESNSVDVDSAKAILSHFISEMKEVLKDTKLLVLPGLGRLRATRDNTFFFVPDEDADIYPEGFGLPVVSLKNTGDAQSNVKPALQNIKIFPELPDPSVAPAGSEVTVPPEGPLTQLSGPPVAAVTSEPDNKAEPAPEARKSRWWIPVVAAVALAAVLLAVFLILAQVAPDFVDSILYSPEELRIINA